MSWNLSWQPEGRSNSFARESILAHAPASSGVYGLFNFDCQIFIGESADVQEALLRHESETDFQSEHLRPTGFTFELCAAELRKAKADELIARFRPVLQTGVALTKNRVHPNGTAASETDERGREVETLFGHQEFPPQEHAEGRNPHPHFPLKRIPAVGLATILVAGAVTIFYFGMPNDYAVHRQADGANSTPAQPDNSLRPANASSITASRVADQATQPTRAKPDIHASTSIRSPAGDTTAKAKKSLTLPDSANTSPTEKWSVQVAAARTKEIADALIEQLNAKGHHGYMVQAEVKGQTYYRVRIGQFDTREQAEAARQSLASREGYRDAFLTGD